ncbi:Pseudouridine synthase, catalytic domain-containing protein [Cynara cardunculus var. scolymus]|uniref:tRNA pseudouridine(55) synthase n=1 Tax=Cynara cardunculus var. scolymus TaxID=59895 RepID=A0A103XLA1_CYNCS|nr:Pseudouridine synthase, catalytic domain-containing protein [Cynara cardunculus var. scolymus]
MAKLNCITRASSLVFFHPRPILSFRTQLLCKPFISQSIYSYSTTKTPFPLQYEMIISRPPQTPNLHHPRRRRPPPPLPNSKPSDSDPNSQLGFDDWVDMKLTSESAHGSSTQNQDIKQPMFLNEEMDRSKRKYYNKRQKRMYGSDSEDDDGKHENKYIELNQEVVKLRTLHKREEELYFYDAFAYPWEKDKHYKMVYQLEKKFFPDQCFDKAFLEPGQSNGIMEEEKKKRVAVKNGGLKKDEKRLVFFEEEKELKDEDGKKDVKMDITEKKVEEFFKCLKKVPNEKNEVDNTLPFISGRSSGLPPKWDGPTGAVLLVNKPKGWTSFTVCGKLRRLVNGPLILWQLVCLLFQGMDKGYSGVLRLGEATSTLDADSPVIQREPWEHIKDDDIKKTAASFCGEIWQVPPMFSAIKVSAAAISVRASTSRRGESIELSPRRISIFQFDVERSLEDSCAHMTALRRDSIGEYSVDDAWEFTDLEREIPKSYI